MSGNERHSVVPSVKETAFNCPYCFALTTQSWYKLQAEPIYGEKPLPVIVEEGHLLRAGVASDCSEEQRRDLQKLIEKLLKGFVVIDKSQVSSQTRAVYGLHLSLCFNCKRVAVWVRDRLVLPSTKLGSQPNPDLPVDIVQDFEEAREIVGASPRGAAALLRLCVQKLCKHLGEGGKNIDADIASLVKKGLNPLVQQALDIVRVIGNESVHPGTLALRDDRETALRLFDIINAIADQMITHPRHINELYGKLPEAKRKAIDARDKK